MYAVIYKSEVVNIRETPFAGADGVHIECRECGSDVEEGWTYEDGKFVDKRLDNITWNTIRGMRNQKLADTDWVILKAYDTGAGIIPAWAQYRQALRDITKNFATPKDVIWPEQPSS